MEIRDSQVLITGANRGIGLDLAKMAAKEGAHLHLVVRTENKDLIPQMKSLGAASVKIWPADLASRQGVQALLDQLQNQPIDILINNAGQLTGGLIEEQPLDDIYSTLQVNVLALIHLSRGLIPGMVQRKKGKIINNASVSAVMHFPCASTYAASKAAVLAFTNCIQAELVDTGVSTLCLITPGIKTRMFDDIEKKYKKNFDVPQDSITAEEYAAKIREAILEDVVVLEPSGATGIGLKVARYLPGLFRKEVGKRFHR